MSFSVDKEIGLAERQSGAQLLHTKALSIVFFTLLIFAGCAVALWQSYDYYNKINLDYLPAIEKQQVLFTEITALQNQLSDISQGNQQTSLADTHQQLRDSLNNLKRAGNFSRSFFPLLNNDDIDSLAIRISSNEERNQALTQETLVLINTINHSMIDLLALMKDRQANLYNQVLADKVSDRVTTSRAIAHTNVSHDIQDYQEANRHLNQVAITLEGLTFLSPSNDIDILELNAEKFNQWRSVYQDQLAAENDELAKQLTQLMNLLFNDARLIAKWRGHTRLATEYLEVLAQQTTKLQSLAQLNQQTIEQPKFAFEQMLSSKVLAIEPSAFYLVAMGLMSGLVLLIFLVLYRMLRKVQGVEQTTKQLVEQLIHDNNAEVIEVATQSQYEIAQLLKQVVQPEHDEQAYQTLNQQYQYLLDALLNTQGLVFIEGSQLIGYNVSPTPTQLEWFNRITNAQHQHQDSLPWRALLGPELTHELIAKLREMAQNSQDVASVTWLFDEQQLTFTILKTEDHLSVFVRNSSTTYQQVNELTQQVEQLEIQQQKQWQGTQYIFAHIQRKLGHLYLSQQSRQRLDKAALRYAQLLHQVLQWSQGGRLWAATHLTNRNVEFTDVKLSQTLAGLVSTAQFARNHFSSEHSGRLSFEHFEHEHLPLANANVFLDSASYQFVISYLLDLQFVRQVGDLSLKTKVVNQNASQLIVRYQFTYRQSEVLEAVPPSMLLVSHQVDSQPKTATFDQGYFARAMLEYLHADKIELVQNTHGWQFSFELPHSTQQTVEKIKSAYQAPNLASRIILIVKDEANRKYLDSLLQPHTTEVIAVSSIDHAHRFLEASRLEKHKIGLVISANEPAHHDEHQLTTLITQLPERLQPKLFIIDELSTMPLSQYNSHSYSINLKLGSDLLATLWRFIKSDNKDNLRYDHQVLQAVTTVKTSVTVLLAIEDISEHYALGALLQWLGLKVTVVTHQKQALESWQTGLYRILVTDFSLSAIDSVAIKKQLKRCVISLSEQAYQASDVLECHQLAHDASAQEWLAVLQSWLVIKSATSAGSNKSAKDIATEFNVQAPEGHTQQITPKITVTPLSFDIVEYANNVGGPELAALMADEYFAKLEQSFEQLKYSLAVKSVTNAREQVEQLLSISRIIASKELQAWAEQLLHCIEQQAFSDAIRLMPEVERDIKGLKQFAEAI
ncbi:hypothetical protein LP316_04305 [Thalassotalea sp. LPB0316]|uniref:hypothetical protein n=1 Tax=Thalassotalea sp. LPB0316 TaxID=2769490 RepID=UPI001866733C|nr:hypothetical protein [Thalassotalea sp. LPB0316]QOL26528.1 hypothetical protein LP316_04305 [Thalassotalea sp. LPB0316]